MIDWGKALETFVVGFGGVFLTLVILMTGINIFSRVVVGVLKKTEKKG